MLVAWQLRARSGPQSTGES